MKNKKISQTQKAIFNRNKQLFLKIDYLSVLIICLCSFINTSCTNSNRISNSTKIESLDPPNYNISEQNLLKEIIETANQADSTLEDGWYYGQESRFFKSLYRRVSSQKKAEFALAFHNWIVLQKQNLVNDFSSYVPYSKRSTFTRTWWLKHEPHFENESLKMQIVWIHESILDANELYWRAFEKTTKKQINSLETIAHDEEQKMLFKFMESPNNPRSLSDEIARIKDSIAN